MKYSKKTRIMAIALAALMILGTFAVLLPTLFQQ
jgi:hypothetical protein